MPPPEAPTTPPAPVLRWRMGLEVPERLPIDHRWAQDLELLLPLKGLVITLRFGAPASFHLFHQAAVMALVRELLQQTEADSKALHNHLCVDAVESGQIHYRKGDCYRFTVVGLPGADALLAKLVAALHGLALDERLTRAPAPFRGKVVLEDLRDLFGRREVAWQRQDPLTPWTWSDLQTEAASMQRGGPWAMRCLSPLALARPGTKELCWDATQVTWPLLAARIHGTLAELVKERTGGRRLADLPPVEGVLPERDLFWISTRYFKRTDSNKPMPLQPASLATGPDSKRLEGLMGLIRLPVATEAFLPALILLQYLGLGRSRAFGWGRFVLQDAMGRDSLRRPQPVRSLLERLMEPGTLLAALGDTRKPDAPRHLGALCERIRRGDYAAPPLTCRDIPKADGTLRRLAIPPMADRQLQRAVAHMLTHNFDTLFSEGSFGYRPQRSRLQARERLVQARRRGLRWSFETDILQCFDRVEWVLLERRLQALFGTDPFVDLLMAWVRAPLGGPRGPVPRDRGLPTGSPLSPVLINLLLDDLDSDLEHQGFVATRYADDLVVQCATEKRALAADTAVRQSLAEKGLEAKSEKTAVVAPETPLRFLGYELPGLEATPDEDEGAADAEEPLGWEDASDPGQDELAPEVLPQASEGWEGLHLLVQAPIRQVALDQGTLVVRDLEGVLLQRVPIDTTASVLLLGQHAISPRALRACLDRHIPVHFATATGRYQGCAASGAIRPGLWHRQAERLAAPEACLGLARGTVHARITHQRELLRRHKQKHPTAMAEGLAAMMHCQEAARQAPDLEALRGVEGLASRHYFALFARLVPSPFRFTGRQRHPAPDPVNALLDLSSSILHHLTDTALRAEGLNPWQGYMHQPHGRHRVLASDLMEPFRHLMERAALVALGGLLNSGDFHLTEGGACRLTEGGLRRFLRHLLGQGARPFGTPEDPTPRPLASHLLTQARGFRRWVEGKQPDFHPWRCR